MLGYTITFKYHAGRCSVYICLIKSRSEYAAMKNVWLHNDRNNVRNPRRSFSDIGDCHRLLTRRLLNKLPHINWARDMIILTEPRFMTIPWHIWQQICPRSCPSLTKAYKISVLTLIFSTRLKCSYLFQYTYIQARILQNRRLGYEYDCINHITYPNNAYRYSYQLHREDRRHAKHTGLHINEEVRAPGTQLASLPCLYITIIQCLAESRASVWSGNPPLCSRNRTQYKISAWPCRIWAKGLMNSCQLTGFYLIFWHET